MLLGWCSLGDGHASTMFAWRWTPSDGWPSDDGLAIYGPVMMTWWGWPGSDDLKCCQLGTRWRPGDDDLWRWRPGDADLGKNRILWRNESPCQKKKNCRIRVLDSPHFQRSRACWAEKKTCFLDWAWNLCQKTRLVESVRNPYLELKKVLCASSYGHFIAAFEVWSQCRICF